jgi:type II secretory pathway predicted ATPase ExeA
MSDIPNMLYEKRSSDSKWLKEQGWTFNPFVGEETHLTDSRMFAGYNEELRQVVTNIDDLINVFIVGSYGAGKSTFVNYLLDGLPTQEFQTSFTAKPSASVKTFFTNILTDISTDFRPNDTIGGLFTQVINSIREIENSGKKCIIAVDEVADATVNIMRWLRVLSDENISLVFVGFPKTPSILRDRFFPLYDRVFKTIELSGLTTPEIIEFLSRRIRVASNDTDWNRPFEEDIAPFELEAVDILLDESGGAPRYLLRSCYDAIRWLIDNEKHFIDTMTLKTILDDKSESTFNTLTRRQLDVAEILFKRGSLPSSEIAKILGVSTAAVDSLLKPLEKAEIIRKVGKRKGYEYALTPMADRYYAREEGT